MWEHYKLNLLDVGAITNTLIICRTCEIKNIDEIGGKIKKNIAFVNNRNFVSVRTKRSRLELNLALKKGELNDPRRVALEISEKRLDYTTTQYALNVDDKSDLGYILSLMKAVK